MKADRRDFIRIAGYTAPDDEWLEYLHYNTYYGEAELPIAEYTAKRSIFGKTGIAIAAIALLIFIPLLAAFAGNGGVTGIESTTTALSAGAGTGSTYQIRVTTTPQGSADTGTSGAIQAEAGWFEGNNKPTQTQPIINSSFGQNITVENITVYNQSFADVDGNALTEVINWYRNGTSIAVLNMPFEKNDPFTAQDYSGNNNQGVVYGAGWNNSGIVGGAYTFNGINQYINNNTQIINSYPFTLTAWIKTDKSVVQTILSLEDKDAPNITYSIFINSSGTAVARAENTGAKDARSTTAVNNGAWHYIAGVFASATSRAVYVDGVIEGTNADSVSYNTAVDSFDIGRTGTSTPGNYFNGTIDEVRIYNVELSLEQIRADYRAGAANYDTITPSMTRIEDRWYAKVWANDGQDDSDVNATANITIAGGCGNLYGSVTLSEPLNITSTCLQALTDNITINCNSFNITGDGTKSPINLTNRNGVTILNCRINNFAEGLTVINATGLNLTNNTITGTTTGLRFNNTNNHWLNNNTITANTYNLWIINNFNTTLWGDRIEKPILEQTTFGNINYTTTLTLNERVNLKEAINFSDSEIFVNSSGYNSLNKSATLLFKTNTLYNAPFATVSFNDSKIYEFCQQPQICSPAEYNRTYGTVSYNVSHFTYYSLSETAEVIPPIEGGARGTIGISPSGSYGGVMAQQRECIIDEDCAENEQCINNICMELFDLRIMRADSPIEPTEILDFTFLMKSMANVDGDVTLEYWVQKPGSSEKLARAQDVIYMKSMQTKITDASLYLYKEMLGEYELVVELTFKGYTIRSITPIEVVAKAPTILTTELIELEPPKFKLRISTNKDREIEVNLEETITKDGKIVWRNKKAVGVKKTIEIEESMGRLEAGEYELRIVAEAEGKRSEIIRIFRLEKSVSPVLEQPKAAGWLKNSALILLYGLGILSILVIGLYIGKAVIKEERVREGRQRALRMINSMQRKVGGWRKRGFDTSRIEKMVGATQLREGLAGKGKAAGRGIEKAGGIVKEGAGKIGAGGIKTIQEMARTGVNAAEQLGTTGVEGAKALGRGLQATGRTLNALEQKLKARIVYWKQRGIDTTILERKTERLRTYREIPTPPKPVAIQPMPTPPKPAIIQKISMPTIKQPAIIRPVSKPEIKPIIKEPAVLKPADRSLIRPVEPAGIKELGKPAVKPIIKRETPAERAIKELQEKIKKWKSLGYDTTILERKIRLGTETEKNAIEGEKERKVRRIKAEREKLKEKQIRELLEKTEKWKSMGYDTTLLENKLKPGGEKAWDEPQKQRYEEEKEKRQRELREVIGKIAKWRADGYDTRIIERQLNAKDDFDVEIKTLENKIKMWKAKGYDVRLLEQRLARLKKG